MKKLFLFQGVQTAYREELDTAFQRFAGESRSCDIKEISVDWLLKEGIEVVLSNELPKEWYFTLKGLNIVSITFGDLNVCKDMADIVIDCKNDDSRRYFAGKNTTLVNNRNFNIEEIADLVKKLEWDSGFFGFNVAYISCMHLTDNIFSRIQKFVKKSDIKLLEYLCNCHDRRSVKVAEKNSFHFADMRLTFTKRLDKTEDTTLPQELSFLRAREIDIIKLRSISEYIYKDSRYFFDERFGEEKAKEFYQGWVEKGVRGEYDDECWCLYENKDPFAFCTLRYGKNGNASIGLFGMDQGRQGKGFGKKLLNKVFDMLFEKGIQEVEVVTQGRNYAAQNLYQSAGFRTKMTQIWYHKWL